MAENQKNIIGPVLKTALFLGILLSSLILWHLSCTWLYMALTPSSLSDAASRGADKKIQLLLIASGALMIPLVLYMVRRLNFLFRSRLCAWAALFAGLLAAGFWFGFSSLLDAFAWIAIMGWASTREAFGLTFNPLVQKWIVRLLLGAFGILLFVLVRPRMDYRTIDLYDDGPKLSAVNQFMLGGEPYRDILLHYGPLREIVQPLIAFRLWGATYDSEQRIRSWLQALGLLLLFGITAQIIPRMWWTLAVGFLFLVRMDLFIPERVTPVLASIFCMCRSIRLRNERLRTLGWGLSAGFLAAASLLYSQEMGLTLLAGYAAYFGTMGLLHERRLAVLEFRAWGVGVGAAASLGLIYLIHVGGVGFLFSDFGALLTYRMDSWAEGLHSHLFTLRFLESRQAAHTFVSLHGIPVLSLATVGYLAWKSREGFSFTARSQQALLLASILFMQFSIYIGRSDFNHWKNVSSLLWPLSALILDEAIGCSQSAVFLPLGTKLWTIAAATLLWMPLFSLLEGWTPWMVSAMNAPGIFSAMKYTPLKEWVPIGNPDRIGPLRGDPKELEQMRNITAWIQNHVPTDGFLFLFTKQAGYYFLTNRRNPTRFGLVDTVMGPRMMDECLQALARHPPNVILAETTPDHPDQWVFRQDLRPIAEVLQKTYVPAQRYGDFLLLIPRSATR